MTNHSPRVTIVIPAYNRAGVIGEAIASALNQTYTDLEVVVVDDGSTDDTRAVVAGYGERVRYVYQGNAGPAAARNRGVQLSLAEYIAFLDSDDLILPTKIEKQVAYLDAHPEVDVVLCGCQVLDPEGHTMELDTTSMPTENMLETILLTGSYGLFPPHIPLLRRSCFDQTGGFDESLPAREEQDFWIRVALGGHRFAMVPEVLCIFVDSPNSRGDRKSTRLNSSHT
jgi:glycosyltransferase involved in cell wall biosynthesis